jgi:carboxymethylenebutenolidase
MTTFMVHSDGGGPYPVAMLYMDGVGYREQIKDNARRFAESGFFVVAPDLYYRAGEKISFDMSNMGSGLSDAEMAKLRSAASSVKPDAVLSDTRAVFDAVAGDRAASAGPKVAVGYCMGARMSLAAAAGLPDDFVAAAGIHPGALVTDASDSPHHELATVTGEL